MAKCLNLTRAGEYALAALSRLALESEDSGKPVSVRSLARGQRIPKSFLSKILARCVQAGIVRSKKGPDGGVTLARPARATSLLAVIEACEGSYRRDSCVFYPSRECEGTRCEVYCPLREREERVRGELEGATLDDMARALRKHPFSNLEHAGEESHGARGRR